MLRSFRVIDSSGELGWMCGRVLADLGADVVKLEPHEADIARVAWQAFNVNKRLLRLDLGTPGAKSAVHALLARA
ncbi:MAG TPA: CoA transferase, partial [Casimicrobiaceae bacterium]|nr:CoA transferase [Casimicrobiaceae bacterium]